MGEETSAAADGANPAETRPNSPETGSPTIGAPENNEIGPESPQKGEAVSEPPTLQPPLPFQPVFGEHGNPQTANTPTVKTGVYVDADGQEVTVDIVAERKDGSVDVIVPLPIGTYRRDGVRKKMDESQTGDYLK